jgi:hypothetical protein
LFTFVIAELFSRLLAIAAKPGSPPIIPYTNVDIFREKWAKSFSKKVSEPQNFMKKWVKKMIVDFFCCHLIQN